jgi:DNA-binding IclR family transcriptional regulator
LDASVSNQRTAIKRDKPTYARRPRVSGIDRALEILDYLKGEAEPCGPYAIGRALKMPLSTAYAIVDDLVEKGLLARKPDGAVWLGQRLYHYGLAYARALDFLDIAIHEMQELCRVSGETSQVCGRDGDQMVVVAMADGPGHFRVTSRVGTRVPLNWTASGRLLVGHLPETERIAIFRRAARVSPTGRAETDALTLARNAEIALAQRLSVQISESDFAVACIASPIRDRLGACVATISVVVPEQKALQNSDRLAELVRRASERIESTLGWRDH